MEILEDRRQILHFLKSKKIKDLDRFDNILAALNEDKRLKLEKMKTILNEISEDTKIYHITEVQEKKNQSIERMLAKALDDLVETAENLKTFNNHKHCNEYIVLEKRLEKIQTTLYFIDTGYYLSDVHNSLSKLLY